MRTAPNTRRTELTGPRLCARCREYKDRSEFGPYPKARDGLASYCRPCNRSVSAAWNAANRGAHIKDPKVDEARAIRANVKSIARSLAAHKRDVTIRIRLPVRRTFSTPRPPRHWTYQGEKNRLQVLEQAGYRCQMGLEGCYGTATQVDHITPKRFGGSDDLDNLQAACWHCDTAKEIELRREA